MATYLVKLTHTGTTIVSLRTFDKSNLNFYLHIWLDAGFGVEVRFLYTVVPFNSSFELGD